MQSVPARKHGTLPSRFLLLADNRVPGTSIGKDSEVEQLKIRLILFLALAMRGGYAVAQDLSSTVSEPPAARQTSQAVPIGFPSSSNPPSLNAGDPQISWKRMVPNIARDQRRIWSFPSQIFRGRNWVPVTVVLGTTAALLAVDATSARTFRDTSSLNGFNRVFSGNNTALATLVVPLSFYGASLATSDSYTQQTALLAGEAVANAEILTTVLKDLDRRLRPSDVQGRGNFSDTWFDGKLNSVGGNGSFPSGHTIAAFSAATVIAQRYRSHRWIPYVAYGAASLIGFSRLSLSLSLSFRRLHGSRAGILHHPLHRAASLTASINETKTSPDLHTRLARSKALP
jgi:membrane-associated phospholipid phosphatase